MLIAEAIGFGHVARDAEILKLLTARGWECEVITYGKCASMLRSRGYKVHSVPLSIDIRENKYGVDVNKTIVDNIRAVHVRAIKKITDVLGAYKPDIAIIDTNIIGVIAFGLYKQFKKTPMVYIINANKYGSIPKTGEMVLDRFVSSAADKILIPDIPLPYTISEYNLELNGKMKFIGPLTRFFGVEAPAKTSGVFIACGKSGIGERPFAELTKMADERIISPTEKRYDSLFINSEIVIHHGGHNTAMESILLGKPQIVIPLPGFIERMNNAKKLAELGVGVVLDSRWLDRHILEYAIDDAREKKKNAQRLSRLLKKYNGAENAYKEIKDLVV